MGRVREQRQAARRLAADEFGQKDQGCQGERNDETVFLSRLCDRETCFPLCFDTACWLDIGDTPMSSRVL
jgi:hypothetical protein